LGLLARGPFPGLTRFARSYIVAQLLKIYFKLNLVKLAQPLIRPLEATAGKAGHFDRRGVFPLGDIVAYRFFIGRLRMFEDHYAEAEEHLAYAFDHCDRRQSRALWRTKDRRRTDGDRRAAGGAGGGAGAHPPSRPRGAQGGDFERAPSTAMARRCVKNKRAILEFLLPVRLRRGVLPKRELLAKYGARRRGPADDGLRRTLARTLLRASSRPA
jgi:hypothetical protein